LTGTVLGALAVFPFDAGEKLLHVEAPFLVLRWALAAAVGIVHSRRLSGSAGGNSWPQYIQTQTVPARFFRM
jgi:hypothetical protein